MSIVIGIDPDADRYGVAIYKNSKLCELHRMRVIELFKLAIDYRILKCVVVIEDVKKNSFIFSRNEKKNEFVQNKVAQSVGMCKQAQNVAEQIFEHYGIKMIKQEPIKGNWAPAKMKPQFQQITGWQGRSNEDTRSAAFLAFLHLERVRQEGLKNG